MIDGLKVSVRDAVATVTLGSGERRNAVSMAMWRSLGPLIERLDADEVVKVIVLRGAGGWFGAGADIGEFDQHFADTAAMERFALAMTQASTAAEQATKPVVAAIEGVCFGGSLALALACDVRYAADDVVFAMTPAKLGLIYPLSDMQRIVRALGPSRARELIFTARRVPADEALAIGLVDRVMPAGEFDSRLHAFTAAMTAGSQSSIRLAKAMVRQLQDGDRVAEDAAALAWFVQAGTSDDFAEGRLAFTERRPPRFPTR